MKNKKKLKYSINSSVVVIGAILVTLLVNSILVAFDSKMSLEIDFTKDEIYRLTDETEEVIKKIEKDTKMIVLYDSTETDSESIELINMLTSLLNKYTEKNEKLTYEVVDFVANPQGVIPYISALQMIDPTYAYASMLFVQEDRYDAAQRTSYITSDGKSNMENIITNKLASFADGYKISQIMLTEGHGEKTNSGFESILSMYNYDYRKINLLTEEIPEDESALVVVNAPKNDFSAEEVEKLDKFLNAGGNVQIYFDPLVSNSELERLESYLLNEWGIIRNHGVVLDSQNKLESQESTMARYGIISIAELSDSDIVAPIVQSKRDIMYSAANAIEISGDKRTTLEVKPVLKTSGSAVLKTVDTINEPVLSSDNKNEYNIMLQATRYNYTLNEEIYEGKMIVCGSSYMMDELIGDTRYANEDLLINSFNWMSGAESGITVRAKELPEGGLSIPASHFWTWFIALVVVVPLLTLGFGIFVFIKRRYK